MEQQLPYVEQLGAELAAESSDNRFGMSIARMDHDIRATYETLRSGGIEGLEEVEGIYATLIKSLVPNENASLTDFRELPPFENVADYLHHLGVVASVTDQGWEIFAKVYDPADEN